MYLVVSKWERIPGHEAEFKRSTVQMRELLKEHPDVKLLESFSNDKGESVVVMGYQDEASYKSVVHDPNCLFAKAAAEHDLEKHGRWVWSERGQVDTD